VDELNLPALGNASLRLFYLGVLFDCLVFSRRLDRARALFDGRLEPYARELDTPMSRLLVEECRATMLFLDGDLDGSRQLFEGLVDADDAPPAARAAYHFFLGCIAEENGNRKAADEAFDTTIELAPETYFPERIEMLRGGRTR
jgi:hypothetical protein